MPETTPDQQELAAALILERMRFFGPQKSRELYRQGVPPLEVVRDPSLLHVGGTRLLSFRRELGALGHAGWNHYLTQAGRQIESAARHSTRIVLYSDKDYPPNLMESAYPIPILFVRGAASILRERRMVACVGSRAIRPPYTSLHHDFAAAATEHGYVVVSGFALGADTVGHQAALEAGGSTIGVMPGGLDKPFPPENRGLWNELLAYPNGVFVSESPFGTRASSMTLRKRNKLIVALSRGVLVSQSSVKGGAMNAYRFALEEKKPVATFESDGLEDTSGNRAIGQDPKARTAIFRAAGLQSEWQAWLHQFDSWI